VSVNSSQLFFNDACLDMTRIYRSFTYVAVHVLGDTYISTNIIFFICNESTVNLPPTKEEVNAFARVCLSVCLSVSKITEKHVDRFG